MKNHSPAKALNDYFEPEHGSLACSSPWAIQRGLEKRLTKLEEDLAKRVARKCGVSQKEFRNRSADGLITKIDEEILSPELYDLAKEFFHAGFDFSLDFQKAQKAFANGNAEALTPFIPQEGR